MKTWEIILIIAVVLIGVYFLYVSYTSKNSGTAVASNGFDPNLGVDTALSFVGI